MTLREPRFLTFREPNFFIFCKPSFLTLRKPNFLILREPNVLTFCKLILRMSADLSSTMSVMFSKHKASIWHSLQSGFELLACVFTSCGDIAPISTQPVATPNVPQKRLRWHFAIATGKRSTPLLHPTPLTEHRMRICNRNGVDTALNSTECSHKESRMLRFAAAGSKEKGCPPGDRCWICCWMSCWMSC